VLVVLVVLVVVVVVVESSSSLSLSMSSLAASKDGAWPSCGELVVLSSSRCCSCTVFEGGRLVSG